MLAVPQTTHTAPAEPEIITETIVETIEEEQIKYEEPTDTGKACNCYDYTKSKVNFTLPRMIEILPNVTEPQPGDVAIMFYGKIKHVAVVLEVGNDYLILDEANYNHCVIEKRAVPGNYKRIVGFYRGT